MKRIYEKRTNDIAVRTAFRVDLFRKEKLIFSILNEYFDYIFNLRNFLETSNNTDTNGSVILHEFSQSWSQFYTSILIDKNPSDYSFHEFLNQWSFNKKYPDPSKRYDEFISNESNILHSPIWTPISSVDDDSLYISGGINENLIDELESMGFDKNLCKVALKNAENVINRAIELLINGKENQNQSQ